MIKKNRVIYVFPCGDLVTCAEIFDYLKETVKNGQAYVITNVKTGIWNGTEIILQDEKSRTAAD